MTCSVLEQCAYITLIDFGIILRHYLIKELTVCKLCFRRVYVELLLKVIRNVHCFLVEIPLEQHIVRNVRNRSVKLLRHTYVIEHIVEQLGNILELIVCLYIKTLVTVALLYLTGNLYHLVHRVYDRLCDKNTEKCAYNSKSHHNTERYCKRNCNLRHCHIRRVNAYPLPV